MLFLNPSPDFRNLLWFSGMAAFSEIQQGKLRILLDILNVHVRRLNFESSGIFSCTLRLHQKLTTDLERA